MTPDQQRNDTTTTRQRDHGIVTVWTKFTGGHRSQALIPTLQDVKAPLWRPKPPRGGRFWVAALDG
jgi:hypothetical protein